MMKFNYRLDKKPDDEKTEDCTEKYVKIKNETFPKKPFHLF